MPSVNLEDQVPGYDLKRLYRFCKKVEVVSQFSLYLQIHPQYKNITAETRSKAEEEQEAHFASIQDALPIVAQTTAWLVDESARPKTTAVKDSAQAIIDAEKENLRKTFDHERSMGANDIAEVYAWDEPLKLVDSVKTSDRDAHARNKKLYQLLKGKGSFRKLAKPDLTTAQTELRKLINEHPNFRDVINFVRDQVFASLNLGRPLRIPPILMYGPPGIGKTHFCNKLAEFLKTKIYRVAFDAGLTSSVLLGSDKHWANTSSGLVFDALALGEFANPIILLDEIDKCRPGGGDYQHPLASLHTLLEPASSSEVRDISVEIDMDASHVVWVAAANYPLSVPSTLRSRFTEFEISAPQGADALMFARVMLRQTHAAMAIDGFVEPDYGIAKLIAHLTAREQRKALERAYACAGAAGRNFIVRLDLPPDVLLDDADAQTPTPLNYLH